MDEGLFAELLGTGKYLREDLKEGIIELQVVLLLDGLEQIQQFVSGEHFYYGFAAKSLVEEDEYQISQLCIEEELLELDLAVQKELLVPQPLQEVLPDLIFVFNEFGDDCLEELDGLLLPAVAFEVPQKRLQFLAELLALLVTFLIVEVYVFLFLPYFCSSSRRVLFPSSFWFASNCAFFPSDSAFYHSINHQTFI